MTKIYKAKGISLREQYADIGSKYKNRLQIPEKENKRAKIAKKVLARVRELVELKIFYECFGGWCEGLGIEEDTGMYLLADNLSGCQTAIVRYSSGVALLHTEEDFEDIGARLVEPRTVEINNEGRRLVAICYHDLMPGAGLYGWQKDQVVAVDSLWLREDGIENIAKPMLANIAAWVVWFNDPAESQPERVVAQLKGLGTLIDGYAINVVYKAETLVEGYKLTGARDDWEIERLWAQPGDNIRQVNIIEPRYVRAKKKVAHWRHAPWKMYVDYRGFLQRLRKMKRLIQEHVAWLKQELKEEDLVPLHREIHRHIFSPDEYYEDYVNEWMGAMCVGILDERLGLSVSMKLQDKHPITTLEYVDRL